MPQLIEVPGQGVVEFPDGMSDADIASAIQRNSVSTPVPSNDFVDLARAGMLPGVPIPFEAALRRRAAAQPNLILVEDPGTTWSKAFQRVLPTNEEMAALAPDIRQLGRALNVVPGLGPAIGQIASAPQVTGPIVRGAITSLGGLTNPENLPYLAAPAAAGPAMLAGFAAQTLPHAAAQVGQGLGQLSIGDVAGLEPLVEGATTGAAIGLPVAGHVLSKGGVARGQETQGRKEVLTMGPVPDWLNPAVLEAQRGGPYPLAPLDPRTKEGPIVAPGLPTPEQMRQPPSGLSMAVDRPAYVRGDPLNPLTIDPAVSFDRTGPPSGGQAADAPVDIPFQTGEHPRKPLTPNQLAIVVDSLKRDMAANGLQVTISPWRKPPPLPAGEAGSANPFAVKAEPVPPQVGPLETEAKDLAPLPRPTLKPPTAVSGEPTGERTVLPPKRELTAEEATNVRHDLAGLMVENLKALGATPEQVRDLSERRKAIGRQVQATGDMAAFNRQVADMRKEITTFVQNAKAAKAASSVPIKPPPVVGEPQAAQPPLAEKPKYPLSRKGDQFVDALELPVGPNGELLPAPPAPSSAVRESDKPLRMQSQPPPLTEQRQQMARIGIREGQSVHEAVGAIARSPEVPAEDRALAAFLHEHFPHVLRMSDVSLGKSRAGNAGFDPEQQRAHMDVDTRLDPVRTTLHEGAHAALFWALEHPVTDVQHAAVREVANLMEQARAALNKNEQAFIDGPMQDWMIKYNQGQATPSHLWSLYEEHGVPSNRYTLHYALQNQHEFLGGVFNKPEFRAFLDSIKAQGPSVFQRIVAAFKRLLGVTPDTLLDRAFDTMWHVGEDRGSLNENRRAGGADELASLSAPPPLPSGPPPLPLSQFVADAKAALPDLKPKDVANRENAIKFASERVPLLGDLLGGKRRVKTPQDEAVATWFAEKHGVAPAVASSVGTQLSGQVDKVFGKSANGDLRVTPTVAGMSLKPSDVFETLQRDPQAYQLSTSQRKVFDTVITPLLNRAREFVQRYDLAHVLDEDGNPLGYFPRIVTKRPGEMPPTGGQARVGAPQSFQQSRRFATEREGWQKGVEYETSVEKALTTYVERLYKAIADKRLIEDPALGAQSYARLEADMRSYYAPELASGQLSETQFKGIVASVAAKGSVHSPAFFGRVFDPEVAKMLNREFAAERSRYTQGIATFNSVLKRVKLGFDLGGGQIQLLPTLFNNPRIWGQANALSVGALAHPSVFRWYAKNNRQYIRELAELGSPTGRIDEYVGGLAGRDPLANVPGVAQVSGAFGRQFQTLLDVAKVEYWKAYRDTVPKSEWPRMVRTIETLVLSGRMESAMVSHYRSTTERALLLAPSYYRAATDFVTGLTESGKSGRVMQKAMGAFVVGSVATYLAFARQSGMSEDEVKKRLDPSRADFMMWDVKEGDKTITMGFGGIFRSFLRLFGNVAKTSIEHPDNWDSLSSDKNPFSRWLRGHLGPIPAGVWTMFSGKDFLGRQSKGKVTTVVKEAITPMAAAEEGGGRSKTASFFGVNTMPKRSPSADELSKGRLGDMAMWERMGLGRQVKAARVPQTPEEKMMTEQRAAEYSMERTVALQKALPKDAQQWLEKNKLTLTPFTATIERKGVSVPLTTDERKKLEQLNHKWYEVYIRRLMDRQDVSAMPASRRQELLNRMLTHAREAARDELVMGLPRTRLGPP